MEALDVDGGQTHAVGPSLGWYWWMLVVGGVGGGVGIGYEGADFGLSVLILHKKSNICVVGALRMEVDGIRLMHNSF